MPSRIRHRIKPSAWLVSLLSLALASGPRPLLGQEGQTYFEAIDVEIVNVDVVVVDDNGRPIVGLEPSDFILLEDGKQVEIVNFFARNPYRSDDLPVARERMLEQPAIRQSTPPEAHGDPLYLVLFLDEQNLSLQVRQRVLEAMRDFLDQGLRPEDRVMIVADREGLEITVPPTSDVRTIDRAVADIALGTSIGTARRFEFRDVIREIENARLADAAGTFTPEGAEGQAERSLALIRSYATNRFEESRRSLERLQEFVNSVATLQGRKAVIYVSDGLASRPGEALLRAWESKFGSLGMSPALVSTTSDLLLWDSGPLLHDLAEHASTHRVTFFTLGGGVATTSSLSPELGGVDSQSLMNRTGGRVWTPAIESLERSNRKVAMLQMAQQTGGLSNSGEVGVAEFLRSMRTDLDASYSLGFEPSHRRDGNVHRIEVEVAMPDVRVRHRLAYRDKSTDERLADRVRSSLLFEQSENPLGLSIEFGEIERHEKEQFMVSLTVNIPLANLVLIPQERHHVGELRLFFAAQDSNGRRSEVGNLDVPIRIPNEELLTVLSQEAGYQMKLAMRGGPHTVAIAVRDELGSVEASTSAWLDVGVLDAESPDLGDRDSADTSASSSGER